MSILSLLRHVVGPIPRALVRREARRFLSMTADCRTAQHDTLRRLLALNGESCFGRDHRLDEVRTVADFRRNVPVSDYEYVREAIDRVKLGEHDALLGPKNRLLMFTLTSGTTSESKFIPITRQFLADYRRGWQIWGIRTLDDHPRAYGRRILQLGSDHDRFRTPGGTPCGNISGLVAKMQHPLVRSLYSVPGIVAKISDPDAKYYTVLRLAVADREIGMAMTANPSTLIHLAKMADSRRDELIRDIADGTLSAGVPVAREIRARLRRRISRRDPARARELERIIETSGRLAPRDYWPDMQVVGVWTGGSAGAYLRSLREFYGEVPIRDHGLSASEGRMTIPFQDGGSEGVLDVTTHFFEFIPEEDAESESPTVLEAHELEAGRNYFILLTTSSGLYRYNIRDVVRCTGFRGTTPVLEFLHKGAHISNLTGEKISESQVVTAVRHSAERLHCRLDQFTVCPVWGDPPHYELLVEEQDLASPAVAASLAEAVDAQLQQLNCEYQEKRQTGRLAPMCSFAVPKGTWKELARRSLQKLGASLEQYKHPCLVPDLEFRARLLRKKVRAA